MDGDVIKDISNILVIEKRRSSAYHSLGNGFAESNIRSVKEMLRSIPLQRKASQSKCRTFLPEFVFALNTSLSKATKCIPYNAVFGRSARLPIDILFNHDNTQFNDDPTPTDYAEERSFILKDIFEVVLKNLQLNSEKMQAQYNKNIRFHDYWEGDRVWLSVKYYKTGENRNLSPRRRGPWTVLQKLPDGLNFKIFRVPLEIFSLLVFLEWWVG